MTRKLYPINQSPLFRILGKGQFEKVLDVAWESVPALLQPSHYRVWVNEKGREIQAPHGWLQSIHETISKLLARIELPDYVHSKKGRSYVTNAAQHAKHSQLIKTDIHKFYPSTTRAMVYRMFLGHFQCAPDVANKLADICCYKQAHLPTGSALSGRIAFFAAHKMFDEVNQLTVQENCVMTTYVDDIAISGDGATKTLLGKVRQTISHHGLKTKDKKSRSYAAGAAKLITGIIVVDEEVRLPNIRHRAIHNARRILAKSSSTERPSLEKKLKGRLREAEQVLKVSA